ncbi:cytidylyltransferase domain-containing protein [Rhodohalobacter sp. 8-1]|uniref:cytidylyltransferase domain-containing protein n=1 Tax=Rhodohalobacter sp. 8-1 TaxID=3131972 RepID=UPI0030EF1302
MSDSFTQFTIHKNSTLKEALLQMTSTHRGILLVTDSESNLIGVIADGDVRRALLDDVSLNIPITQVMNLNPVVATSKYQAEKMLEKNPYLIVVPVVNEEGKLSGLLSALNGDNFYPSPELEAGESNIFREEKDKVKYLAIIPARGGSKRIPGKNLSKIGPDSLLALAIKSAQESSSIDEVIVSTDSREIASEAERNGVKVPWMRPESISGDEARTVDVMLHALDTFVETNGYRPDHVVLLEPTAPLRSSELIDRAVQQFEHSKEADSLVSVNKIRHIYHPEEILTSDDHGYLTPYLSNRTFDSRKGRKEQEPVYIQNGLIYITNGRTLAEDKSIYGNKVLKFETDDTLFADIDEPEDLEIARLKYKNLSK